MIYEGKTLEEWEESSARFNKGVTASFVLWREGKEFSEEQLSWLGEACGAYFEDGVEKGLTELYRECGLLEQDGVTLTEYGKDVLTQSQKEEAQQTKKPKGYDQVRSSQDIDYAQYAEEHKEELLRSAAAAIDPDKMGMDRQQAMTLAGAMKNCGFSREEYEAVMARSSQDKGTFSARKQWNKWTGKGQHGTAGEGTIFDYAKQCGWKWPAPYTDGEQHTSSKDAKPPQKAQLANMAKWSDDFKLSCIMDSVGYTEKPSRAGEIRSREKVPTPTPQPMTIAEFAKAVVSGHTFSPTVYSKELTGHDEDGKPIYKYRTVSQQLFVVDIDNEERAKNDKGESVKRRIDNPLTIEAALQICERNEIQPFFIYETFSSKLHRNDPEEPYSKFRLCFALNEPMTAQEYGERGIRDVINYFIGLFGKAADTATTDPARLIYGTDDTTNARAIRNIIDKDKLYAAISKPKQEEEPAADPEATQAQEEPVAFPQPVGNFIDLFKQHRLENKQNIRTGFKSLDIALGGGFGNELYILGAETGTGKSAIASVLAQNIAQAGITVLYYALEMGRDEFIARGASAISAEDGGISRNTAIKYGEILNDTYDNVSGEFYRRPYDQYERHIAEYSSRYGKHLYIIEGGTEGTTAKAIKDTVEQFKQENGATRLAVFVDYLQLLSADPEDKSQRDFMTRMSTAVKVLKTLASQIGAAVFLISSMANDRKGQRVNDASFKYSGDISYTGSVLLGWNWQGVTTTTSEDEREQALEDARRYGYRKMTLEVLKHRSGERGNKVRLLYYPAYNYITEEGFAQLEDEPDIFKGLRGQQPK